MFYSKENPSQHTNCGLHFDNDTVSATHTLSNTQIKIMLQVTLKYKIKITKEVGVT